MPAESIKINNNYNNISLFEKGNYVSFNSENPIHHNNYAVNQNKTTYLLKETVEEVGNGSVLISCRNRLINLRIEYRRDEDQVTLISKKHLYFRCSEEKRVAWYGSKDCSEVRPSNSTPTEKYRVTTKKFKFTNLV